MKTAVVGSGIGGLISALLLAKDGHDVTVYEKEETIGGRLAFVQEGDYKIDKGPTIVLLPDMLMSILLEAGIDTNEIEFVRCDPSMTFILQMGKRIRNMPISISNMKRSRRSFQGMKKASFNL